MSSLLDRLTELLGPDTFFVPCAPGTKRPLITYKERPKEKNASPVYQALFHGANVAVYLGKASGGLCAIDFDRDEDLAAFLAANPRLEQTLRSRAARGAQVWVRMAGEYPDSCKTPHFEWRATGNLSMIWGRHPKGMDYHFLCDQPPITLAFGEITWPADWDLPWVPSMREEMERRYGPILTLPERGSPRFNQSFLVAKLLHEHGVLFDDLTGRFYQYEEKTGRWCYRSEVRVQKFLSDQLLDLIGEIKTNSGNDSRLDALYFSVTQNFLRQLTDRLKNQAVASGVFQKPDRVIHVANGVVDLTTRPFAFKPFDKRYYSRNQVPVAYDPAALCPRFFKVLLAPALELEDIDLLQYWCGMALLGRNLAQKLLILSGTAGGGKGTIVNVIQGILGEENLHGLRTAHLDSRFETSFYLDKTLLYGADVDPNFLNTPAAHQLKALTGGDPLTTECKGSSETFKLKGDFNILMTCNSRLMVKLQGDAEAWARRLLWIDFHKPPPTRVIPLFAQQLLKEEGPGILNWMLEGAAKLLDELEAGRPFPQKEAQRQRVNDLLSESDAARSFITTCIERSAFPLDCVTSAELFTAYLTYCDARGWAPLAQRAFEMKAKDLMIQIHRACPTNKINRKGSSGGQRGFQGVTLKQPDAVELEVEGSNEPL